MEDCSFRNTRAKFVMLALFLFSLTGGLSAETNDSGPKRHVLRILPFFQFSYGVDNGFSSLSRAIFSGGLNLGYDYRGRIFSNELTIAGGAGAALAFTVDKYLLSRDSNYFFNVSDALMFNLLPGERKFQFSLGGEFSFNMTILIPEKRLNYAYLLSAEFRPVARVKWQFLPRHGIRVDLTIPLIGVGWRPAWGGSTTLVEKRFEEQGILGAAFTYPAVFSWHNNRIFRLRAEYEWIISDRINLIFGYTHIFINNTAARPHTFFHNLFTAGMEIKL